MLIIAKIDKLLNKITMYRLLVYGLGLLAAISLGLSIAGVLALTPKSLVMSLVLLLASCYVGNRLMAAIWRVTPNNESWLITALILFFIMPPGLEGVNDVLLLATGGLAMASKYIVAWKGKHLFNPAAFAATVFGLIGVYHASWWIGNSTLWPLALILGLLVVRKIRRFSLLFSFAVTAIGAGFILGLQQQVPIGTLASEILLTSPLIFLGTIMLTEPSTMPPRKSQQMIFGGLVGLLYGLHPQIGSLYIYPEVALCLGNLYAFAVSPRYRLYLTLERIEPLAQNISNYVFRADRPYQFKPGQYMEWTLKRQGADSRGNRRTFTIASSPTEDTIQLGVKFYEPSSSYKQALATMKPGEGMFAGQISGSFTLLDDASRKLLFVAGGVGITPFRSMLKYLEDRQSPRDIVLFYLAASSDEIVYQDVLRAAATRGARIIPVINGSADTLPNGYLSGPLTVESIQKYVPDLSERQAYISGPNGMVDAVKQTLQQAGARSIKTDHFAGY